jgi:hypothetical protein
MESTYGPPTAKSPASSTGQSILERIRSSADRRYALPDPTRLAKTPPREPLIDRLTPEDRAMLYTSLTVDNAIADGFTPDQLEPDAFPGSVLL